MTNVFHLLLSKTIAPTQALVAPALALVAPALALVAPAQALVAPTQALVAPALALFVTLASPVLSEPQRKGAASDAQAPVASAQAPVAPESAKSGIMSSATPTATTITWYPYEVGLKRAETAKKQTLIDFSTAWCGYCKKMDKETFTDPRVIKFVNDNFVAIRVDGDSKREFSVDGFTTTETQLTKAEYGVRGFPTFWFLESNGSKIGQMPGYLPADDFLGLLEHVKARKYEKKPEADSSGSTESSDGK